MYNTSKAWTTRNRITVLCFSTLCVIEWIIYLDGVSLIETTAIQDCIHRNCRFVSQVVPNLFRQDLSINPETETKTKLPRASQPGFQLCCQTQYYYNTPASSKLTHRVSPQYTSRTTVFCCNNKKEKKKQRKKNSFSVRARHSATRVGCVGRKNRIPLLFKEINFTHVLCTCLTWKITQ